MPKKGKEEKLLKAIIDNIEKWIISKTHIFTENEYFTMIWYLSLMPTHY